LSYRLIIGDQAKADLVDIAQSIAERSGDIEIGDAFVDRLIARCEKIASLPGQLGTARTEFGDDLRSTPLGNYLIIFRYAFGQVDIRRVIHARRDLNALFGVTDD